MDGGEHERGALSAELLRDLAEDVGTVGVGQVDRVGVDHDRLGVPSCRARFSRRGAEAVGVGEEERPVDAGDEDPRDGLEALVTLGLVVGPVVGVVSELSGRRSATSGRSAAAATGPRR